MGRQQCTQTFDEIRLLQLAGADIDSTMIAALDKSEPKGKAELARSLGMRRAESAVPALLKCAEDAEGAVRQEAWKALGLLGRRGQAG